MGSWELDHPDAGETRHVALITGDAPNRMHRTFMMKAAHSGRGTADRGEHRQAARVPETTRATSAAVAAAISWSIAARSVGGLSRNSPLSTGGRL
jgi:hypothetical protein